MADTKMSALPPAAALAGADIFAVAQGGVSVAATATQIATFVGGASAPPFVDTQTIIKGSADATKLLRFEVDGFTAGVTNVLTPPNQNATIAGINVPQTFSAVQTFTPGSNVVPVTIVGNVTDPNTADFLDITGTWNTTAVQTAIKLNVTNTASGAGSLLLDLKTGTTKFNVGVTGATTITPSVNALGLTFADQTYTADSPSVNISQTWNNAGVTFMAIKAMITDTASAAASSFIDLQLPAGTSKFVVRKDGRASLAGDILVSGALSPAITAIKVNVGIAAAQNVIRINGNSTADNAPVLDFLRSGNREWTFAPISNSFFISNSGGVANFNDATLNATPNWEFTSLGALKINGGTAGTGLLHVNTDTTGAGLTIFEQASADTDDYDLSFRKARGTVAAPTVITVGDRLGTIIFRGYSGAAGYVTAASIRAVSTGTIATTRVASSLVFATGTDAAPTVLTDRLTIDNMGSTTISTTHGVGVGGADLTVADSVAANNNAFLVSHKTGTVSGAVTYIGFNGLVNAAGSTVVNSASFGGWILGSDARNGATASPIILTSITTGNTNLNVAGFSQAGIFSLGSDGIIGFASTADSQGSLDATVARDSAGIVGFRNGGVALYETRTNSSNYSRTSLTPQSGNHLIRTEAAGTGTLRILQVGTGPSTGTDIAGISTILHGGQATGAGAAGAILFQQSLPVGGSGAAVTALATTASFTTTGLFSTLFSSLIRNATAIPAGGTAGSGYMFSSTSNFGIFFGSGAPSLVAAKGSLYLRSDGGGTGDRVYVATDSAGAWTAITTAT